MAFKKHIAMALFAATATFSLTANAQQLTSPKQGVLCDKYVCADKNGVSPSLTGNYLDQTRARKIVLANHDDEVRFTFSDGTFCDVDAKTCYVDRYFDSNGKRSKVNKTATQKLFGR